MSRVHVIGAAGYAAGELIRLLLRHPQLELGALESTSHAGEPIGTHVPLARTIGRNYDGEGAVMAAIAPGDVVVCAGKGGESRGLAPRALALGARLIDLSDEFRLHRNSEVAPGVRAVYGFCERYRDAIRGAAVVANPGCYPTSALLALLPLAPFASDINQFVIDAKSGISGAGRSPKTETLFAEVDADVHAYGFSGHRHEPEIAQELAAAGLDVPFVFTPQVVPLKRGMLTCAYAMFRHQPDGDAIAAAYRRAYDGNSFVRILPPQQSPSLPAVAGTNDAEIHLSHHGKVVRVLCALDNLGKGAAAMAVQSINLMLGYPEECGLDDRAIRIA